MVISSIPASPTRKSAQNDLISRGEEYRDISVACARRTKATPTLNRARRLDLLFAIDRSAKIRPFQMRGASPVSLASCPPSRFAPFLRPAAFPRAAARVERRLRHRPERRRQLVQAVTSPQTCVLVRARRSGLGPGRTAMSRRLRIGANFDRGAMARPNAS